MPKSTKTIAQAVAQIAEDNVMIEAIRQRQRQYVNERAQADLAWLLDYADRLLERMADQEHKRINEEH